jgi:cobalt transporter subunit CbtA
MFRRMCLAAVAAGLLAGALVSVVQHFTTTPLILRAEEFERAGLPGTGGHAVVADSEVGPGAPAQRGEAGHDHHSSADSPAEPSAALERVLFTTLADVLVGIGFAFLVVAALAWKEGGHIGAWTGISWGAAGFAVFTLAPALGLPPELPGLFAADLAARQLWWAFAAGSAAVGLGLLTFGRKTVLKVLGVVVALVPHVIGAPSAESVGGSVPPELASQFAATSIVVSAIFWALLGWLSAVFYQRFAETA